jgi:hypothetical protein
MPGMGYLGEPCEPDALCWRHCAAPCQAATLAVELVRSRLHVAFPFSWAQRTSLNLLLARPRSQMDPKATFGVIGVWCRWSPFLTRYPSQGATLNPNADATRFPMKTYAEIKAELEKLEALDFKPGDWVWLKASDDQPRRKAQLRGPLAAVILVTVPPESEADDGLRVITADKIEGKVV